MLQYYKIQNMIRIVNDAVNKQKAIGEKIELVPKKLTKIKYRQGEGSYPKSGDIIEASYILYSINGKQIQNKSLRPKKFIIGRGRLIQGLEIAFTQVKKNQKFTLIISPEYGYQNLDVFEQSKTLKNKLVAEFIIKNIYTPKYSDLQDVDKYIHFHMKYREINQLLAQEKYDQALQIVQECYLNLKQLRTSKYDFLIIFIQKWVNILIYLERYEKAKEVNKLTQKFDYYNQNYLLSNARILLLERNKIEALGYLKKYNESYGYKNTNKKRRYIEILKEQGQYHLLKHEPGYDQENDIIYEVSPEELERIHYKRKFRSPLLF